MANRAPMLRIGQQDLKCRQGCGFYGNTQFDGLCSKCFRERNDKQRKKRKPVARQCFYLFECYAMSHSLGLPIFQRKPTRIMKWRLAAAPAPVMLAELWSAGPRSTCSHLDVERQRRNSSNSRTRCQQRIQCQRKNPLCRR